MARPRFVVRSVRTAVGAALAGVVVLLGCPGAWADVTVTPNQAPQGSAPNLTFLVPDDRGAAYTTKVEVQLPAASPIGEVDPLSVEGWAPMLTYRTVATPVQGIMGANTQIPMTVTWTRAGAPAASGAVSKLTVSMGPLPSTAKLPFVVVQTYSDHVVRRWTATALTLTPNTRASAATGADPTATAATSNGMQGMDGMAGMGGTGPTGAPVDPATGQVLTDSGSSTSSGSPLGGGGLAGAFGAGLTGGVVIAALAGGVLLSRNRRAKAEAASANAVNPANAVNHAKVTSPASPTAGDPDDDRSAGSAQSKQEVRG
jgi:uncharacterized protein YcnI